MNRNLKKTETPKPRERLSVPPFLYPDHDLEDQFFPKEKTRMMLPSGRMVNATPPPSEPEENYASSMPELIYLQSRSFSPDMFGRLYRNLSKKDFYHQFGCGRIYYSSFILLATFSKIWQFFGNILRI